METSGQHRERVLAAFAPLAMPPWPFQGTAVYEERDVANDRVDLLQFDQWCVVSGGARLPFDADVYRLLARTLKRYPDRFSGVATADLLPSSRVSLNSEQAAV